MPSGKDFMQSITIIAFASAIVALGAQELYQRHGKRTISSGRNAPGMLQDLLGPDVRARMSPEAAGQAADRRKAEGSAQKADVPRDQLTKEDRSELDSLLDGLLK